MRCWARSVTRFESRVTRLAARAGSAEHMLIVGVESPAGETHYIACAFPSACGKTNLAMLIPPASQPGWKIWTLGDDIAWLHPDESGQLQGDQSGGRLLRCGTRYQRQDEQECLRHDPARTRYLRMSPLPRTIEPWWEDKKSGETGCRLAAATPNRTGSDGPAAHPNSRFTVDAKQNPSYSSLAEAPQGVPISAIVFGGRRKELAPLRLRSAGLAARRSRRRWRSVRNHRRGDGQRRRRAPRPDGHETVLRL